MTEVLIVGGSFAGLAAARELRGRDVVLVDRSPIGAHQTSACALPVALVEWLGAADAILHADRRMRLRVGHETWRIDLPEPFCTIDYEACCRLVAAQCDARFAQLRVTGRDGDSVLGADGERLAADHLVDASGWRRVLDPGGPVPGADPDLVTGTEDHVPVGLVPPTPGFDFIFDRGLVQAGYAWSFPSGDHARVGVGSFAKEPLNPAMDALRAREGVGAGTERHGGAIGCVPRAPVQDGILFCGDAAGQALPLTLEGIRPAVFYGAAAGRLVRAVLEGRVDRAEAHARYAALHAAHLGGHRRLLRAQRLVRGTPDAVKRLAVRRWLGRGAVGGDPPALPFRQLRYLEVLRAERLPALP
jgi:flavin-dependent dehydrogenase